MKLLLSEWAARHYTPPPSQWVLRQWARNGEIFPPPERCGRHWYVEESAERLTFSRPTLVQRMKAA
jgi:predicted site-specific integrase-resolvase